MKKILILILTAATLMVISGLSLRPAYAALDCSSSNLPNLSAKEQIQCGACDAAGNAASCSPATSAGGLDNTIKFVIELLSIIAGIAAVVMIIIAGLKYITSGGNADKIKSAKGSLIYAIIGIVIVVLAQTIVYFAFTEATKPSTSSSGGTGATGGVSPGGARSPH